MTFHAKSLTKTIETYFKQVVIKKFFLYILECVLRMEKKNSKKGVLKNAPFRENTPRVPKSEKLEGVKNGFRYHHYGILRKT
jgi:hypothetical protein